MLVSRLMSDHQDRGVAGNETRHAFESRQGRDIDSDDIGPQQLVLKPFATGDDDVDLR